MDLDDFKIPEPTPVVERPKRPVDLLAERLGYSSTDEFLWQAHIAGWTAKTFREAESAGDMPAKFARALDAGMAADLEKRLTERMRARLGTGPAALAGISVVELAAFISEPRLRSLALEYEPGKHGGRLVCGPTGIGKSVAGVAALRRAQGLSERRARPAPESFYVDERQARERSTAWVRAFDLPNARLSNSFGNGEASLVTVAIEADFLVLDDLGWESKRAGADDVVAEIIAARYDAGRITYATTGLSLDQFGERYGSAVTRRLVESGGVTGKVVNVWPKATMQ